MVVANDSGVRIILGILVCGTVAMGVDAALGPGTVNPGFWGLLTVAIGAIAALTRGKNGNGGK